MNSRNNQMNEQKPQRPPNRVWLVLRPVVVFLLSAAIVVSIFFLGFQIVMNRFLKPIEPEGEQKTITVEIKSGWGTSSIANALYGNSPKDQLIRSKAAFKIYVDFVGKGRKLRAGTYEFQQGMTLEEIVNKIAGGESQKEKVIRFTLIEGMTVESMAKSLQAQGVLKTQEDVATFLSLCKTGEGFETLEIPEPALGTQRKYLLEGYLFPDTYEVYEGTTPKQLINRLLTRFNGIMDASYDERMQELGMTTDQVITIASMIEKESKVADFAKVSAVFHNRLKENMYLQSDATVRYVLDETAIDLNKSQLQTETPYNTHTRKGLPIGPIANPGKAAIEAALWPNETYVEENFLYFCLKEPEKGDLVFTKTLAEHEKEVAKYKKLWIEYDKKQKEESNVIDQTPSVSPNS